jgi:hypothetical protein
MVERFQGAGAATLMALYGESGPLMAIQRGRLHGVSPFAARTRLLGSRFSDVLRKAENVYDVAAQGVRNVRDVSRMDPDGVVITNASDEEPGYPVRRPIGWRKWWLPGLTLAVLVLYGKVSAIEKRRA